MPITWKNIQAPDFRAAQQGVALAGQQIDKAFGRAQGVVQDFEDKRQETIDLNTDDFLNEVRTRFRDPADLAAARESGALDELRGQYQPGLLNKSQTGAANMDVLQGQLQERKVNDINYQNTLLKENSRAHYNRSS